MNGLLLLPANVGACGYGKPEVSIGAQIVKFDRFIEPERFFELFRIFESVSHFTEEITVFEELGIRSVVVRLKPFKMPQGLMAMPPA